MTDIDTALSRLGDLPLHPGLGSIDQAVLTRIAEAPRASTAPTAGILAAAALMALGIGISGSLLPGAPAPTAAFGAPPALAPSSLLGGA